MVSVQNFLRRHPATFYWTFTVHEVLADKEEAMKRAKPLFDLIARKRGIEWTPGRGTYKAPGTYLAFWELQKRGSWHLHLLTNVYLDVNWLRPWMVERGWGPQMRVELVNVVHGQCIGLAGQGGAGGKLARYLCKYLSKSFNDVPGKKPFSGSVAAKAGTVGFAWAPDVNPVAYLFYWGRKLFFELYERLPRFDEFREVVRLGYEDCDWASIDFLYVPP